MRRIKCKIGDYATKLPNSSRKARSSAGVPRCLTIAHFILCKPQLTRLGVAYLITLISLASHELLVLHCIESNLHARLGIGGKYLLYMNRG